MRNPYDRRASGESPHMRQTGELVRFSGSSDGGGLQVSDLDVIAERAYQRGLVAAEDQHATALVDAIREACREAWDEGKRAGETVPVGRFAETAMPLIAQQMAASEILKRLDENPRRVTKAECERRIDSLFDTLSRIRDFHRGGFDVEVPF